MAESPMMRVHPKFASLMKNVADDLSIRQGERVQQTEVTKGVADLLEGLVLKPPVGLPGPGRPPRSTWTPPKF